MSNPAAALVPLLLAAHAAALAGMDICQDYAPSLSTMVATDQALRSRWQFADTPTGAAVPHVVQLTELVDRQNTIRLKAWIAACGWPKKSTFGAAAVNDAWLLAQHADQDLRFQKQVIGLLRTAVENGEAPADHLAYLSDRVALAEGKSQLYGTQLDVKGECTLEFRTLDDPVKVDARRKAIGWSSLAQYRQLVRENVLPEHCRQIAAPK